LRRGVPSGRLAATNARMSPTSIQEPERIEAPAGGTMMSAGVWGAPGSAPVLLLHGLPTNALLWRRFGPTLSAEGFRAFAPDLLGYGKSGDPTSGKLGIADQARYVHQFVAGVGLRDMIVVGHDIGGGVAQHLAISHPELVIGLILVNSVAERNWPARPVRLARTRFFAAVGPVLDAVVGFPKLLGWAMRSATRHPARLTRQAVEAYAAPIAKHGGSARIARLTRDLTPKDTEGLAVKLAATPFPKLVVWGANDPYLKVASGRRLAADLGNATVVEIPDSGHYVPEEEPFALAEAVLPFLKSRLPERQERVTGRLRRTGDFPILDRDQE
jgi:2-hydroxymuconate-semialdehyde hydrolase